jgi:lipopolysaccharide export system permease protein
MPWTLYRYILLDVLKVLVPATIVLVLVISFLVAMKPLADGMLGPGLMVKFILYTMPTVLGFALPFAAAFASTFVFIRLATDNEITAAATSGISYAKILLPILALGLAMTMGLFIMANFVVPSFNRYAARTLQKDFVTAMVSRLNQNRSFVIEDKNLVLYADQARSQSLTTEQARKLRPNADTLPTKRIQLTGFAGMKLGGNGNVEGEATARRAEVLVYPTQPRTTTEIQLFDYVAYTITNQRIDESVTENVRPWRIKLPQQFESDPEHLSYWELRRLRREPHRHDPVQARVKTLGSALARTAIERRLKNALAADNPAVRNKVELAGAEPGSRYVIHAPRVTKTEAGLTLSGETDHPVQVSYFEQTEPGGERELRRRYEADRAELTLARAAESGAQGLFGLSRAEVGPVPTINLTLQRVSIYATRTTTRPTQKDSHTLARLRWPGRIFQSVNLNTTQPLRIPPLRKIAGQPAFQNAGPVQSALSSLSGTLHRLNQQIFAQFHRRAASAIACLLLLVLGAVLSMQLKGQMPLVVYLWSFLLAIFALIIIHASGRQMAGSGQFALWEALGVMWSANLLLAIVIGVMYCRLARH